jgi:PLP dependent protein
MQSIAENLQAVREQIDHSIQRFQRVPGSVTLLAVSKTHPASCIREAYRCGVRDFGENYVQEALGKIAQIAQTDINWHLIGPIQSNKTRDIAGNFQWVHSVDRIKIAARLNEQRPAELPPLNVCIQVNISQETSKSGLPLAEVPGLCNAISSMPNLRLRGLMAIPAPGGDFQQQRQVYQPLAAVFRELSYRYPWFDTLSIGMSSDFDAAIAEGSTLVRIGTAIFGNRPAKDVSSES